MYREVLITIGKIGRDHGIAQWSDIKGDGSTKYCTSMSMIWVNHHPFRPSPRICKADPARRRHLGHSLLLEWDLRRILVTW